MMFYTRSSAMVSAISIWRYSPCGFPALTALSLCVLTRYIHSSLSLRCPFFLCSWCHILHSTALHSSLPLTLPHLPIHPARTVEMFFSKFVVGSAIATLATATGQPFIRGNASTVTLKPAVHPTIDRSDYTNIRARQSSALHYDSDANSQADSINATMSVSSSAYPLVQLENTAYVKSVTCSANTAEISFSNQKAFKMAVQDWQSYSQFVIVSHSPECGSGYASSKRDFALAKNMTNDPTSMTVSAAISFVDYQTAIGKNTTATTTIGKYTAPSSKLPTKRTTESETISWNEYPTNSLSDSQWGSGYQLYSGSGLDLVCVNCGTQGSMTLMGTVTWSTANGIETAQVSLSGSMSMTMEVGVSAQGASTSIPIGSMSLAQIPLAAIDVPDIMTIGPQLDISASASVSIGAAGSLLAGATLNWPSASATLVLDGAGSSDGSGWTPSFSPVSSVQGTISATLNLDLPVEIGIGVNLLNGEYNKNLGFIDTPSLQLAASAGNAAPCDGVGLSAGASNNVVADVLGLTTVSIASYTTQIFSTCVGGGSSPTPTPAARSLHDGPAPEKVRGSRRYRQAA